MRIGHLLKNKMTGNFCISGDESLVKAAAVMNQNHIGSLVVKEGGKVVSIVTERDVMRAVSDHSGRLAELKVADVMATTLICCDADDSVDHIMDIMINNETGHRIRHLPVMENGNFIGVISMSDIIQALLTETKFENNLLKNYIKNWPEGGVKD